MKLKQEVITVRQPPVNAEGRAKDGRFGKNNAIGKSEPGKKQTLAQLKQTMLEALTKEDEENGKQLIERAIERCYQDSPSKIIDLAIEPHHIRSAKFEITSPKKVLNVGTTNNQARLLKILLLTPCLSFLLS